MIADAKFKMKIEFYCKNFGSNLVTRSNTVGKSKLIVQLALSIIYFNFPTRFSRFNLFSHLSSLILFTSLYSLTLSIFLSFYFPFPPSNFKLFKITKTTNN